MLQTTAAVESFAALRDRAREAGPKRVAVVDANDEIALPVLIGDAAAILDRARALGLEKLIAAAEIVEATDAPACAARMARDGTADVLLYEELRDGVRRLVAIADGGLNVAPTLEQKVQIVRSAIAVLAGLGFERPRIAILSATEAVSASVPSTLDAQALAKMGAAGEFGNAEVFGPLALDKLGVHSIEPGLPATPEDQEVIRKLMGIGLKSKIVPSAASRKAT